jgi:hypothetical protein
LTGYVLPGIAAHVVGFNRSFIIEPISYVFSDLKVTTEGLKWQRFTLFRRLLEPLNVGGYHVTKNPIGQTTTFL